MIAQHPLFTFLLLVNVCTFLAYAWDKRAAPRQGRRIRERSLHVLAALGGSPAALAGQYLLRHKTRKQSFQLRFWAIACVQILLLLLWMKGSGRWPFTP